MSEAKHTPGPWAADHCTERRRCSKCRSTVGRIRKIGKGAYCNECWAKIQTPPRAKDSFEFYDKIYHPTTGKPPGTWEFAEAYAEYRLELVALVHDPQSQRPVIPKLRRI